MSTTHMPKIARYRARTAERREQVRLAEEMTADILWGGQHAEALHLDKFDGFDWSAPRATPRQMDDHREAPCLPSARERSAAYAAGTETPREHVANAIQILTLSHDPDDVDAALARLHKALRGLPR